MMGRDLCVPEGKSMPREFLCRDLSKISKVSTVLMPATYESLGKGCDFLFMVCNHLNHLHNCQTGLLYTKLLLYPPSP